jgi:hypothetical protein
MVRKCFKPSLKDYPFSPFFTVEDFTSIENYQIEWN